MSKGASNSNLGAGVAGSNTNGYGIFGTTTNGYAVYANGRLGVGMHLTSPGLPTSGSYDLGDIVRDNVGDTFACVVAGSAVPNAVSPAAFRKIAGPATAGQIHFLQAPVRVYDSRPYEAGRPAGTGQGPIVSGITRSISLLSGFVNTTATLAVPTGAVGAVVACAIVNTVGAGRLGIHSASVGWPGNSSINWHQNGQILNSTTMSALSSSAAIGVTCSGTSTDFVIDVVAYLL